MTEIQSVDFNLLDEPFIPCDTLDGRRVELGLRDLLLQAHKIAAIRDDSPLVTIALFRLGLALLHAAIDGPKSLDEWADLWQQDQIPPEDIDPYCHQWRSRFDLFADEFPFYQAAGWELPEGKQKGTNELAQELSGGNNAVLFDHTSDAASPVFSAAEAARYLVANQTFAAGGGRSETGMRTAAPLVGQVVCLVVGENLFETLLLNLIPACDRDGILQGASRPVWETDGPSFDRSETPDGYLDLLTWQPRRIRLHPDETGHLASVSYSQGRKLSMPDRCFDSMTAYRQSKTSGMYPLQFQDDRDVWRDSQALFTHSGDDHTRPAVLQWLDTVVDHGSIDESYPTRLVCGGAKNDQAKIAYWRHETLPLPPALVRDEDLQANTAKAVNRADEIGKKLSSAVRKTTDYLLDSEGGSPDKTRSRQLADSLQATRLYWSRLDTPFSKFLVDIAVIPRTDEVGRTRELTRWTVEVCKRQAVRAFEESAGRLDDSARTLKAVEKGRGFLYGLIYKYLKTEGVPLAGQEKTPEKTSAHPTEETAHAGSN